MYHGTSYESATKFIVTRGDIWASMNEAGQLPRRAAGSVSKFTQVQEYDRIGWSAAVRREESEMGGRCEVPEYGHSSATAVVRAFNYDVAQDQPDYEAGLARTLFGGHYLDNVANCTVGLSFSTKAEL